LLLFNPKSFVFPSHIKNLKIKIYITNFAGCAIWVQNLISHFEGGTQIRVFKNRVLRSIFGPKRKEDRSWRKLYNDELHQILLG
jgi:hypothetical protein